MVRRRADRGCGGRPRVPSLPERFSAFHWHFYTHGLPSGARELARSSVCTQAFRLGDSAWGVQFHPEVTREIVDLWIEETPEEVPGSIDDFLAQTEARLADWNELGRTLCGAFLDAAEQRIAVPA